MNSSNLTKRPISLFLAAYFGLRIFSYFFSPNTPLYSANPINWTVSIVVLLLAVYLLFKNDDRGWLIIAGELILGGAGSFLEIKGISLRTLLLISSMAIFGYQLIKNRQLGLLLKNSKALLIFITLLAVVGISALRGYYLGHNLKLVLADTIPYLFLLYYFPLKQLLTSETFRRASFNMLIAAIIGNFIFIYLTLAGFSSGVFALQDSYYHWFRDIASGKITDYATGFFRILTNEQLLLVPLLLLFLSDAILSFPQKRESSQFVRWIPIVMGMTLLPVLAINLTRIYLVALTIGILFLFSVKNWKRWLAYSAGAFIFFIVAFSLTHLAATKGKSLGWENLGLRLQSIAMPQIEDSSLSRMMLLPKIMEKIKLHPLLGNGLGDTVTVYSPVFDANITTPHFDWGYLEIIDELGSFGFVVWILLIVYCLLLITKTKNKAALAALVGLLVINITSPALFHVLGIVFLMYLLISVPTAKLNSLNSTK